MDEARLFDGPAYDPAYDNARLSRQIERVYHAMRDGEWRTLATISRMTGDPQASVSAQLRHLRKRRFGGHAVNRRGRRRGAHEYQLVPSELGLLDGVDRSHEAPSVPCPCCGGTGKAHSSDR